jgi:hypothetical protein
MRLNEFISHSKVMSSQCTSVAMRLTFILGLLSDSFPIFSYLQVKRLEEKFAGEIRDLSDNQLKSDHKAYKLKEENAVLSDR